MESTKTNHKTFNNWGLNFINIDEFNTNVALVRVKS